MAKIRQLYTKTATHGTTPLEGLREVTFGITPIDKEFGSDGEPIESESVNFRVVGTATFEDVQAYNVALALVEGNLVVVAKSEGGGADRSYTFKNITFRGTRGTLPTRQDPGVGTFVCDMVGVPGSSDTPATMIVNA